jgi:ankyrin repeat protein
MIEYLIQLKCSVNQKNKNGGLTPLHSAVEHNNIETLKILMGINSTDYKVHNFLGQNIFMIASLKNFKNILDFLLSFDQNFLIEEILLYLYNSNIESCDIYQYLIEKKACITNNLFYTICSTTEKDFDLELLKLITKNKSELPNNLSIFFIFIFFYFYFFKNRLLYFFGFRSKKF